MQVFIFITFITAVFAKISVYSSSSLPPSRRWQPERQPIIYKEFNPDYPTYTIISSMSSNVISAILELEKNKINYVHIDKSLYTKNELNEILIHYTKNSFITSVPEAMVFLEDKKYIGELFELYQEIFYYQPPSLPSELNTRISSSR